MEKLRVGFLCYGLSAASTTTLNPLAEEAGHLMQIKAFPLVYDWDSSLRVKFSYRPTRFKGRYFTFNTLRRNAPEGTLLS